MSIAFAQPEQKKGISVGEPPADHSPEAELKSFKVLDGFEVNLFASEADGIPNPIAIRWDERGRLWVLQTSDYPQPKPGTVSDDKIIILEDTDHDGRADKSTVFAGGLSQPMGMELAPRDPGVKSPNGHSVYVGEGEKLWLMHDDDGDDRVDRREVVFSGFGTGDTHQCLNSFIWAPDGALVMHQGLHCYSRVTTVHGTKTLYGAGFWHYYPKSGRLNPYPTGMPLNAWGTAFTKWGQPIMVAGAAGMFWARPMEVSTSLIEDAEENREQKGTQVHGVPHFVLERFQLPYSGQIIKTSGLRKFCGIDIVGNAHWPESMQEEIISGGFFENAVYRYKLVPDKEFTSGMEAVEQPPLITSDNVAFRPIDIRFGPEGALYIADWYDPIIGHYQASFRHPNRDAKHGRIWRVLAKGRKLAEWSQLNQQSQIADLFERWDEGDRWTQYQAGRLLGTQWLEAYFPKGDGMSEFGKVLAEWAERLRNETNVAKKQHILWRLHQAFEWLELPDFCSWAPPLHSDTPEIRAYTVHTLGHFAGMNKFQEVFDPIPWLVKAVEDDAPLVRLEAVVAAAKVQSPEAIKVALKVLDKPMDSFIERALWLAVHATAPHWKKPPYAILQELPPKHLAFLVEKEGSAELLGVVRTMLTEKGEAMEAETRRALMVAMVRKGKPDDLLMVLKLGMKDPAMLDELAAMASQRAGKMPEGTEAMVLELLKSGSSAQKASACVLAGAWRVKSAEGVMRELLKADEGVRAPALTALSRLGEPMETFENFAKDTKQPWNVRTAALAALVEKKPVVAGQIAAEALGSILDADAMRAWLSPLLARDTAVTALAESLEQMPCSAEAAKLAMTTLTAAGRGDAVLTTAFGKILGVKNTVLAYDAAWVNALAAEVKSSGDVAKGKTVFNAPLSGCTACHKIGGQGGVVGPELDAVGRGVPVELLIEAVVWPNRQIKEGYVATTLTLKDGRKLQGYKVSEAGGELQLRELASGQTSRFTAGQIAEKQEAGSLMPEGLIMNMTREELRDLVAYLAGLGR
ncbi:PVC-type heme-binding CxxCH protein [Prosthecobacter sp.]|uniref:PVC-type heme-binding CxxCH protein n=1 Tax=Prosthecobacter sp. TaxID=1965333 RepID=UPI001DEAF6D4|nr:PVC-type heme-binding CxxCH protein [Prosthecobacter sp.]MCB1277090.1 HEAT repeat domain-containing protein [Prosthecobacter sp.]